MTALAAATTDNRCPFSVKQCERMQEIRSYMGLKTRSPLKIGIILEGACGSSEVLPGAEAKVNVSVRIPR